MILAMQGESPSLNSCPKTTHLLLQPLQHGSQVGLSVLLIGFHLLGQFFLCHLDEVVVFFDGFLDHFPFMFAFLCQVFQELSFLVLEKHKRRNAQRRWC